MIVIDTNVASEPLRHAPDARVLGWLAQHASILWITSVTIEEMEYGWRTTQPGRRRDGLAARVAEFRSWDRLLGVDAAAAVSSAEVRATRRAAGRPIDYADALIAGICLSRGAALATRNGRDFEGLGLELINPWDHVA